MAPATGRTVWPKPSLCLTIDTGEMLLSIALAECESCRSSQDSSAGSCRFTAPKLTQATPTRATPDAGC